MVHHGAMPRKRERHQVLDRIPIGNNFREIVPGKGDPPRFRWFLVNPAGNVLATCPVRGYAAQAEAAERFEQVRRCLQLPLENKFERQLQAQAESISNMTAKVESFRLVTRDAEAAARRWRKTAILLWMVCAFMPVVFTVVALATLSGGAS